jgi:hypothetical protein
MSTGSQPAPEEEVHLPTKEYTKEPSHGRFWVRVVISSIVVCAALYVILSSKYSSDTEKWAFGIIGLIVGYWLNT